ncbi:MAG: hypothetical protein AAFP90_13015 [Planctomycetota bacterium]
MFYAVDLDRLRSSPGSNDMDFFAAIAADDEANLDDDEQDALRRIFTNENVRMAQRRLTLRSEERALPMLGCGWFWRPYSLCDLILAPWDLSRGAIWPEAAFAGLGCFSRFVFERGIQKKA